MNFIIPYYDDDRLKYTCEYLKNQGFNETDEMNKADFAIYPPATKKNILIGCKKTAVYYAMGDYDKSHKHYFDYNKRADFIYNNAVLTAEGAIALYKQNSEKAIFGSKILITGYGKIAKILHKYLDIMGSDITICCRSEENYAQAKTNNAKVINFKDGEFYGYDAIFNTVPAIVFTKKEIDAFSPDTKYIELASFPGGIDKHYAQSKGIEYTDGSKLPARYSKKSAGYYIGQTVERMIKEGLI